MGLMMFNKNCKDAYPPNNWLSPKTLPAKNIEIIIKVILCLTEFAFIISEYTDINNTVNEIPHPIISQHLDIYHFDIINN